MKFFRESEFTNFDQMDGDFLTFLDVARGHAGVPFVLTDSWRDPGRMPSGGAKRSAHYLGRAVDVNVQHHDYKMVSRILTGALKAAVEMGLVDQLGVELVDTPTDSHVHIDLGGTWPDGYTIPRPAILYAPD